MLCASCGFTSEAVAFSPDGHTLTVVVDRTEMSANSGRDTIFDWHVTGSGTLGAVTAAARAVGLRRHYTPGLPALGFARRAPDIQARGGRRGTIGTRR